MAGFTYTTLKQAIQDYCENTEATFVSQLDTFIKVAEERILKEATLEVFRKNATSTLASGNKYFPKPGDWLSSFSMSILVSGDHKFLLNKDVNFIQEYWPDPTTTGEPKYYADFTQANFILAPTPGSTYTVELHYLYRPDSIVDITSGITWLGTNASQAMLYGALVEAYIFMKGEADLLQQYEQRFVESLRPLQALGVLEEPRDKYRSGGR
jgi:hypothetical protein